MNAWIRDHESLDSKEKCLSIGDTDLWVHKFGSRETHHRGVNRDYQYIMMVEIKCNGADLNGPQRDTLMNINHILRTKALRTVRNEGKFFDGNPDYTTYVQGHIAGKPIQLHAYGVHKLRMSGHTPDDSKWLTWDDKPITRIQLLQILSFEIHPDSLRPMEDRTHRRKVNRPSLLDDMETT
jgi:hypothetical protein